jgi:hypothetical protein
MKSRDIFVTSDVPARPESPEPSRPSPTRLGQARPWWGLAGGSGPSLWFYEAWARLGRAIKPGLGWVAVHCVYITKLAKSRLRRQWLLALTSSLHRRPMRLPSCRPLPLPLSHCHPPATTQQRCTTCTRVAGMLPDLVVSHGLKCGR